MPTMPTEPPPDCEKCPFQVVSKETKAARLTQGATVPTRKGKHYG